MRRKPHAGESGFTLIEVMVALAIVGIALTAVMRAIGTLTQNNGELRNRSLAQVSAENRLTELQMDLAAARTGTDRTACPQGGLALVCQQRIRVLPLGVREVTIDVFLDQRASNRLATLTGVIGTPSPR